jgi:tetratricopeptide (TPR) repeat protein
MIRSVWIFAVIVLAAPAAALAEEPPASAATLSAPQLFAFADAARDAGDFATAEAAYRALATNPDLQLRSEARFRLAMMLADRQKRYREAAVELRKILDEQPKAARVRLELGRMHALLGNAGAAERELRAAEAGGLPPEVERLVRFYAGALSARKRSGGSLEVAIAPDSNINRATKSATLGTVIGDFTLDDAAKAHSGVGLSLRGQGYLRLPLGAKVNLLTRLSSSAEIYRQHEFDDFILGVQTGPEILSGADRITVVAGPTWRWYGAVPYSFAFGGTATWQHPLGKRAQLRLDASLGRTDNRRNDLQDATVWSLAGTLDRAFSARFGGGIQLYGNREVSRDPGWSTASGGANLYAYRELGPITAVASVGYSHLEADEQLALYPRRRIDDRVSSSLSATFRQVRIGSIAPLARIRWERNRSSIELYDYSRIAADLGITSAF